jgi:ribonuclease P protein component
MARATFPKHEHLRGRLRIQEVITTGTTVRDHPFKLVGKVMQLPTTAPAQVAFAIPKRYMPLAVHRNRARRLMREAYRMNKGPYHERLTAAGKQCAWLFVYQGRTVGTLREVELKITRSLDRWMKEHG